ncbi:MAG: insulinase family protein, partial [Acetivibrio ethanolgignens]
KVFSIGFRTPPVNSTGVAHIIEHTVLCGSKKFPVKDPFIELAKGSLNTFLNAMTYPDKTIYPVASCNDKDFANLMDVYMDAVFHPNIYKREEIFLQEGWHYELERVEDEITINGVVYNEMKGAFSSPEQVLYRLIQQSLFPDTAYGVESGGDPAYIPDLSYEEFLDFHRKYYHASNSYIYLYGNMDVEEKLRWMDEEYLGKFGKEEVDSRILTQESFSERRTIIESYPVTEESDEDKTYLSYNVVMGTSLDRELYLAIQILDYVLLSAPGAPLKQAILDAGIGNDILSGSYENGIKQPYFSIITKNAGEDQKEDFLEVIETTLRRLCREGLSKQTLLAAINYFEFKYREADFGQFPKGLMYGIQMLDSWLYDDTKPFIHVCENDTFARLRKAIDTGYYEELIETYLLDNPHSTLVVVKPEAGLTAREEESLKNKLAAYKASLSKEELEKLVKRTKELHIYEETPSTEEELLAVPMLSISDIKKEAARLYLEEKKVGAVKVLHHNLYTNGIAYVKFSFEVTDRGQEASWLSLLSTVLGYVDTKKHSFGELSNEINIHTGGIGTDVNIYNRADDVDSYTARFEIKTKALYQELSTAFLLIREMVEDTIFNDTKRMQEILAELKSRLEMRMNSSGHSTAVLRGMSYFSESDMFDDLAGGVGYYRFICELEGQFEEKKEEIENTLRRLAGEIFRQDNLLVSVTADEEGYQVFEQSVPELLKAFQGRKPDFKEEKLVPVRKNEGLKTPGQVQFVARCGNYMKKGLAYTGALRVLKVILSYEYLWNAIRIKGGAYGCMCGFSYDGKGYLVSYRDPELLKTDEVYKNTADYIKGFEVTDRDMTKYIIGAISALDTPLTPMAKGSRSFGAYLCGVDEAFLQKERDEVL